MRYGLELAGISKAFGATRVLDEVSLDVEPGEFLSLVGPSGCGKSTLLRIISGLERQDAGQIRIGGTDVGALGPRARNIAMVFQNYALYPHMSAFENIALPLTMGSLHLFERLPLVKWLSPRRAARMRDISAAVANVAAQLKIEPLLARKPGQLSGGQRQRVALARAMVREPSLFLMDEPLSNLDAQLRVHMRDELAELHARLGATFIYVTHDQVEAMTMSSRIAMLDGGRLAQVGTPSALYETPATLAVARFIGSPAINILPGEAGPEGEIRLAGQLVGLVAPGLRNAPVMLGIRPEHLRLMPRGDAAILHGVVRRNEHHGAERLIHVELAVPAGQQMVFRVGNDDPGCALALGQDVALGADPARVHVFGGDGQRLDVVPMADFLAVAAQ